MSLDSLPLELVTLICLSLDRKSLFTARFINRMFYRLFSHHKILEYHLELYRAGMDDGPPNRTLSVASRLDRLKKYQAGWSKLALTSPKDVPTFGDILNVTGSLLSQGTTYGPEEFWKLSNSLGDPHDFEVLMEHTIASYAVDPSQDLLVVTENFTSPSNIAVLMQSHWARLYECENISLQTFGSNRHQTSESKKFRWSNVQTKHYDGDNGGGDECDDEVTSSDLELADRGKKITGVEIDTSPVQAHVPAEHHLSPAVPFQLSWDNRLFVLSFGRELDNTNMSLPDCYIGGSVPWMNWGPRGSRMLILDDEIDTDCVYGSRFGQIVYKQDAHEALPHVEVLDFNMSAPRSGLLCSHDSAMDVDTVLATEVVIEPTTISVEELGLFTSDVVTYLPYRRNITNHQLNIERLMLGEEHIVAINGYGSLVYYALIPST
ncbi:hypothetical protein BD410DRAFT_798540 [Rickenella mellea]|uniref:F-box domain-containing protein n=1 Tax=Rickenella mellea TaxID=50990 RepID=A0A4R5XHK6_9AGAM|nr:hypothetical protein BD410DRAFT_798540 [Rickenella mellea]